MLAVLLLGIVNATQVILPRTDLESNQPYQTAKVIAAETEVGDAILMQPHDVTMLFIMYFAERRVLLVQQDVLTAADLPAWIDDEVGNGMIDGGRLLFLDADGSLHEIR